MIFCYSSPNRSRKHYNLPKCVFLPLLIKLGDFYLFQLLYKAFHNLSGFSNLKSLGHLVKNADSDSIVLDEARDDAFLTSS